MKEDQNNTHGIKTITMIPEKSKALTLEELTVNIETQKHIDEVRKLLERFACELRCRGIDHDRSKLERPEVAFFAENTRKLKGTTYGSEEYKKVLSEGKDAIEHHYKENSHHPEHNGLQEMDLLDVIEMFCDWKAATLRHDDGNMSESTLINIKRFGIKTQLGQILLNTLRFFEK